MEKLREDTIRNVRACLISIKGAIPLHSLRRDYMQLMGEDIPFKKCGFKSLEDFLRSEPSLSVISRDGTIYIDAKATQKTSHISQMVTQQKASKKKRAPMKRSQRNAPRFNHASSTPVNKWKTTSHRTVRYETSVRKEAINHRQFVNSENPSKVQNHVPKTNNHMTQSNEKYTSTPKQNPPNLRSNKPAMISSLNRLTLTEIPLPMTNNNVMESKERMEYEGLTRKRDSLVLDINASNLSNSELEKLALSRINPDDSKWNHWSSDDSNFEDMTFVPTGVFINDVEGFAKFHKLGEPVYRVTFGKGQSKRNGTYICQLHIGEESWLSLPEKPSTDKAAKEVCAKLAWPTLLEKYGLKRRMPVLLSEDKDVMERVPILVKTHINGVWSHQIAEDYKDYYKEQLPSHWLDIIKRHPCICIEQVDSMKFLLRFCQPGDKPESVSRLPMACDISIPTSTVNFSEKNQLTAIVVCAISAQEIWCRQICTEGETMFNKLLDDMEEFYNNDYMNGSSCVAKVITVGGFYAAWIEDFWFRVRILDVDTELDEVNCFLVDRGDDIKVKKDCVYVLMRQFAKVPEQTFLVRLFGLEDVYDSSVGSECILNLEGGSFILENVTPCSDDKSIAIGVVMYEKIDDSDDYKIINLDLLKKICIENALPVLHEEAPNDVIVTNIESNGDLYVQVPSLGKEKLMLLISDVKPEMLTKAQRPITKKENEKSLFFYFNESKNRLDRVKIIDWHPNGKYAQIYFIDYGNDKVIELSKVALYPLEEVDTAINSFPAQAVLVKLDNLNQIKLNTFKEKTNALLENNEGTLLKITGKDDKGVPLVKLFVRSYTGGLVLVNEILQEPLVQIQPETKVLKKLDKLSTLKVEDVNLPTTGFLKEPSIPPMGEFFEVIIALVSSPWNFVVQPRKSRALLQKLRRELHSAYDQSSFSPVKSSEIKPGHVYVSKREDGKWYRTCVIKVLEGSISVYYCDYGQYGSINASSLFPIKPVFLELPYQAIKAKLSDIEPLCGKWSLKDCEYFKKLVLDKELVSVICSVEMDALYKSDKVLALRLIDTTTNADVDIGELMILKGIAS